MGYKEAPTKNGKCDKGVLTHFASVNSGKGFISYYNEIFGNKKIKRRYIIKGGPGTGKSSLLRSLALRAEEKGMRVEYFRCSSDPESLDGIIIDGRIALLDGTAPHTYEPNIVGAQDEIINLGSFWNADRLYEAYNDIVSLSALKANSYKKAYRFLSAAMNVEEINRELVRSTVLSNKMRAAIERMLSDVEDGDVYRLEYGMIDSIGMKGRVRLDTYERFANKLYCVFDHYGSGYEFISTVADFAVEKKLSVKASYDPLVPYSPNALMLVDQGIAFVLCDNEDALCDVRVNMKRFVNKNLLDSVKTEYRANRRLKDALITSAIDSLKDAGRYHFQLESIYSSCMDFEAENKFLSEFFDKIL